MRYCDNCGGTAGSRILIPQDERDPIELFYCDDECKAALERKHENRRTGRLQLVHVGTQR